MKFIKRNKLIIICIAIVFIILLASGYSVARLLFPDLGSPIYGNRIDDIDEHKINDNRLIDITNNLKKETQVVDTSIDIKGRLINIIIDVKDEVTINEAKNMATKALTEFTSDEKSYYDIQIFMIQDTVTDSSLYPIVGYKHKLGSTLVWTEK